MKITIDLPIDADYIEINSEDSGCIHLVSEKNEDHCLAWFDLNAGELKINLFDFVCGTKNSAIHLDEVSFLKQYAELIIKKHGKDILEKFENAYPSESEFCDVFDSINGHRTINN